MKYRAAKKDNGTDDLLQKLLITQLGLAGVAQRKIREIVGCDLNRVTRIVRHLKTKETK